MDLKRAFASLIPALLLAATSANTVRAADSTPAAADRMAFFAPMLGVWEGAGWTRQGPGETAKFVGQETVTSHLDGRLVAIEGKHWDESRTRVVHSAFATISWDPGASQYLFHSVLADGRAGDYRGAVRDAAFVWELTTPGGTVRYTISISGDRWHETGEMDRGGQLVRVFEMTLARRR